MQRRNLLKSLLALLPASIVGSKIGTANNKSLGKARIEKYEDIYGRIVEITYDSNENQLIHKNSSGFWIESTYDESGNPLTHKNSSGYWAEYTYDENGKQLTYKDSSGFNVKYTYDEYGSCISGGNIKQMISVTYI